jgi:hypothetical protein
MRTPGKTETARIRPNLSIGGGRHAGMDVGSCIMVN